MNYIDAIRNILNGNPVENLENLRKAYNKIFKYYYPLMPLKYKRKTKGFPESGLKILSSFAHYENEILKGNDDSIDSYLELKKMFSNPDKIREKGRKTLKYWLKHYPFNDFLEKMKEKEIPLSYFKNFSCN